MMIRRVLVAGLTVLVSLAITSPAVAIKPPSGSGDPFAFVLQPDVQIDNLVEQQTDYPFPADSAEWTINPFDFCYWDVDDHWQYLGRGYLPAGASVSLDQCFVSDPDSYTRTINGTTANWSTPRKYLGVYLTAPSPDLVITVCYQPQGRCLSPGPVGDGQTQTYQSCTQAHHESGDPALVEIPGSQGGVGVVTTITLTVTNPTSRKVQGILASTGPSHLNTTALTGCQGLGWDDLVHDYPFRYHVT